MRCQRQQLAAHGSGRQQGGGAGIHHDATGKGADTHGDAGSVGQHHIDLRNCDTQLISANLRQRGLVSLALGRCASEDTDPSGLLHAHRRALERPQAGTLDIVGQGDAQQAAFGARGGLALGEALPVDSGQGAGLTRRVIPRVIAHRLAIAIDESDRVRHLLRLHQIAPAQLGPVQAQLLRRLVEYAFHREHTLRPAGAAHRCGRTLVGMNNTQIDIHGRHHIRPRHGSDRDIGRDDAPGKISTIVMRHQQPHTTDACLGIQCQFDLPPLVTLLSGGEEMLAPVLDPFHRPSGQHRCSTHCAILGIENGLATKATTDIGMDHPHLFRIPVQQLDDVLAVQMRCLTRLPVGQLAGGRVMPRQVGARLHGMCRTTVLPVGFPHHMRCALRRIEGCGDIAIGHLQLAGEIVLHRQMRPRRSGLQCLQRMRHRRQHLVIHLHQRFGILGDVATLGQHHRHRITDVDHLVLGQHPVIERIADGRIG